MAKSPPLAAPPAVFTIDEAADQLRCSRSHVYSLIKRDLLRRVKIGSRTVIPASEIARLAEEGTQEAPDVA